MNVTHKFSANELRKLLLAIFTGSDGVSFNIVDTADDFPGATPCYGLGSVEIHYTKEIKTVKDLPNLDNMLAECLRHPEHVTEILFADTP